MNARTTERWSGVLIYAILALVTVVTFFPIYYVTVVSFTDPLEYLENKLVLFPKVWSLDSYRYILSNDSFINAISISTFLAVVGTALSLMVTAAGAYALSRKRLAGRKVMLVMVLITTLFNPGLIPPYLVVKELGLINSLWSLILPVLSSGFYVLLMKGFFDSIPDELEESAKIDGASDIGVFFRIILPLSLASLAAFGLFYAVGYWNTFMTAVLYINDPVKRPLQILLQILLIDSASTASGGAAAEMSGHQKIPSETLKMASVVVGTLPIVCVYPFLQKYFAKGVMIGSVKG